MLDGVELPQAQRIASEDEEVLAQHGVPSLEGDFLQDLGRRAVRVTLSGVLTGAEAGEDLKGLREKFHAAAPVPFVSDIGTATKVDKVLIEEMGVRELAGKTERFEYALSLREYTPPPAVTEEPPPVIPPPPVPVTATLVVEVIVEGDPAFDFSRVRVTAMGTETRTLTNRANNVWTETDFPPGSYTVEAAVDDPEPMTGSAPAEVREGETTQVSITLRRGAAIAKAFVIHFWFDKAFIEPCLREVLQRVVAYSDAHPDEKVLIVGHTDLVGSDDYNQSLSERRGRSVHAYLTSGRDRAASIAEWNELRKQNPGGITIHDTWGTREIQYMLEDLGFYFGNIDEDHGPATDAAIRAFQTDHGLTPDGVMGDATWEKLVEAYLDEDPLSIPEERFFRNSKGACNGGIVKWLGCGEQDPVLNTQDAWRPNRRTEILFIKADAIPCEVPKPVTFELPSPGFVGTGWCLGPGNPAKRCCFTTRKEPQPGKWLVRPAEPGKVLVQGTITFEDGTPVSNAKYALIAPDGEYLHTTNGAPDKGERPSGPQRGRPIPNRADAEGRFSHPVETPEGVYILEIFDLATPQVARSREEPSGSGRGNVVCFRLDAAAPAAAEARDEATAAPAPAPPAGKGGVVQPAPAPAAAVNPSITPADPVVVVRRSYTNPARVPIRLGVSARFRRGATLTRSGDTGSVRLFTTRTGTTEFTFDVSDEARLTSAQLNRSGGFTLFAESDTPSGSVGGYHLTLTLDAGSTPVGPPAVTNVTAVRVTLDIFTARGPSGAAPQALPPVPPAAPAPGTAADKWFLGGVVNVQDAAHSQERVQLRVQSVEPSDFTGNLELRQVAVSGNTVGAAANRARGFENASQTAGETAVTNPLVITVTGLGFPGESVFLEGVRASAARRDTGFQVGVQGASPDADRVALTVGVGVALTQTSAQQVVVVKRPHTNPTRPAIRLRSTAAVPAGRQGTLTVTATSGSIKLFTTATGNVEITNAANNVFTATQLNGGVDVFAEGVSACTAANHIQLVLTLSGGAPAAGIPGSTRLTVVALTLDVGQARTAAGVAPVAMTDVTKANPGRFVHLQDAGNHHGRAQLLVRPVLPAGFACTLQLVPVDARVGLFTAETGGITPVTPFEFLSGLILGPGMELFAEGTGVSAALRDTGFHLDIDGQEGDRVNMTVVRFSNLTADIPSSPAQTVRMGNSPVARHTAIRATTAALNVADYDVDFAANVPVVLLEGAVLAANPVNLSVTVAPANVPVSWDVQRDTRPAPDGDHPSIVALSPNPRPTLTPNVANPLLATMVTNAVGSFHIRPFVDTNGNGRFDAAGREPFLIMNLVLVRVTENQDNSTRQNNFSVAQGTTVAGVAVPGSIAVSSGTFNIASPGTTAIHMNVQADLVGGGDDGLRGVDRVFAGWVNNESANETVLGTFLDSTVAPPVNHTSASVFVSNIGSANGPGPSFLPTDAAPALLAPPLLDTGRNPGGRGGDTACLRSSRIRTRTTLRTAAAPAAVGQRLLVEAVDSPSDGENRVHPGFPAARLVRFRFGLTFRASLCFWTNASLASGATGDPADRLYVVLRQLNWTQAGEWTINPATGVITQVTAPSTLIASRVLHNPVTTVASSNAEVREPRALAVIARDARA
jgi:outer membrane protein OmpA-like peptidoglycan-associated protein